MGCKASKTVGSVHEKRVWSFGFGSNMDVGALRTKKMLNILDHMPAVAKDWEMSFSSKGIPCVEPFYALALPKAGAEIHGMAFSVPESDVAKLDAIESGYSKGKSTFIGYDGREVEGFLYTKKDVGEATAGNPSSRYLGVLVNGAKEQNLNA